MVRGTLQPYEILVRDRQQAGEAGRPSMLDRHPVETPRRQPVLALSPWTTFAATALIVSLLAFAYTLGRHDPLGASPAEPVASDSLDDVRRQEPVPYEQLQVDRGR